jgi:transposase
VLRDMNKWTEIRRRVLVDGQSKRSVCQEFDIHWDTLTKILGHSEPPGYRQGRPRHKPKIGPFLEVIEEILRHDQTVHRKQRHTKRRIFERLREEYGYTGGHTAVKEVVCKWELRHREAFMPLSHPPGEAQVDFGQARIIRDSDEVVVAVFVMTLPYSDAIFVCIYPRECTEAFLDGHRRAFEFFSGVPRRISYDNSKIAIKRVICGRERELTDAFLKLQSHYLFEHHFCLVGRPNEKGHVENLVGYARRNFMVPVPRVSGIEELNTRLEADCRNDMERTLWGKTANKAQLLVEELGHFLPLPSEAFEARRVGTPTANSLSLVRFDRNDYSVPTDYAYHQLTVLGGIEQVSILFADTVVATHKRCWGRQKVTFDPIHYLALLERKPGALDVARPLENWHLPECFGILRRRLENELEGKGTREFIRVLRLLESTTVKELANTVEHALSIGAINHDAIRLILEHRREQPVRLFSLDGRLHLAAVQVQPPDLHAYRGLLVGGAA